MARSMMRLCPQLLFAVLLIGSSSQATAGLAISLNFSGQGVGTTSAGTNVFGFFVYDQSKVSATPMGKFAFQGPHIAHVIDYKIGAGNSHVCASVYHRTIHNHHLRHKSSNSSNGTGGTTITIVLPMNIQLR